MSTAPNQRARGLELGRTAVTTGHESLFAALQRLDRLLEAARDSAEQTYGSTEKDPYRGFYVSPQDFRSMLERPPGAPLLFSESTDRQEEHGPLGRLQRRFDLSSFDLDALLIVLAPEIDLRYQRLYAYLQDDVTRKRPSIDLVLNLLCPTAAAKIDARPRFGAEAPLIGNLLLRIASNDNHGETPLLARELRMEDAVVAAIVGECELDQCICPFSKLVHPGDAEVRSADNALTKALIRLAAKAREEGSGRVFYFQGHRGAGSETAAAIALALDCQLLSADLHTAVAAGTDLSLAAKLLPRDARLHDAVLYLEGVDALRTSELQGRLDLLLLSIRDAMGLTIVCGRSPLGGVGTRTLGGRERYFYNLFATGFRRTAGVLAAEPKGAGERDQRDGSRGRSRPLPIDEAADPSGRGLGMRAGKAAGGSAGRCAGHADSPRSLCRGARPVDAQPQLSSSQNRAQV
ncbi:MAG: hypothetical protein O7D91_14605 [Planctomycetota bacterium]|nr:hypothetical protein [Planctomycetota bacterium]